MSFELRTQFITDEHWRENDKLVISLVGRPYDSAFSTRYNGYAARACRWLISSFESAVNLRKKLDKHGFEACVREV